MKIIEKTNLLKIGRKKTCKKGNLNYKEKKKDKKMSKEKYAKNVMGPNIFKAINHVLTTIQAPTTVLHVDL